MEVNYTQKSSSYFVLIPLILLLSISYGYSYYFVKKLIPKGFLRVISLLPLFYILFNIPWFFNTSIFLRGLASFFLTWISSFKLLLFAFGYGDLSLCNNFSEFLVVAILPLKINLKLSRLELVPVLSQIHRATSLRVFWGKRWNRISSDILRHTIYEPTLEKLKGLVGLNMGKIVALMITLVVSGIMHEIMFYHMSCGKKPTWDVTRFFVLQGVCMAIEAILTRFWVKNLGQTSLHPVVSVPLTLSFLMVTSYWLLVLPVLRIIGRECNGLRLLTY